MIEDQIIIPDVGKSPGSSSRPTIIPWKNAKMIAPHAIQAAVLEIARKAKNRDVVKVGFVGEPHTGKTTQVETVGHIFHKLMKKHFNIDYAIRRYGKEDFIKFEETLEALARNPANYILQFGDLSFIKSKYGTQKIAELEQSLTEIRHLPGGRDVKILLEYDYHYTKGLPPYIRQADFMFYTGIGSSEKRNMDEILDARYHNKIMFFKKMSDRAPSAEKFTFRLGTKGWFTYQYKQPFIPMLFWNQERPRIVVSPTRQWIDAACSICSNYGAKVESELDVKKLREHGEKAFGSRIFESAVKLMLRQDGIDVYSQPVRQAEKWLYRIFEKKIVSKEDIAAEYGYDLTRTSRLRKPIDEAIHDADLAVANDKQEAVGPTS